MSRLLAKRRQIVGLSVLVGVTGFLGAGYLFFGSTGRDDVFISVWPAFTLVEFGELVNYNFSHVEQSSSLLTVVVNAALYAATRANVVSLFFYSSIGFGAACIVLSALWLDESTDGYTCLFASMSIATSGPFVHWGWSGMEASIAAFCLLAFCGSLDLLETRAYDHRSRLLFAVVTLTVLAVRPEMPIVLVATAASLAAIGLFEVDACQFSPHVPTLRAAGGILSAALLGGVCLLLFRYWYFGAYVPQPVSAKAGVGVHKIYSGLRYFLINLSNPAFSTEVAPFGLFLVTANIASASILLSSRGRPISITAMAAVVMVYQTFILFSGGDWMEAGRFFVPIVPLQVVLLFTWIEEVVETRWKVYAVSFVILSIQISSLVDVAKYRSTGVPSWEREQFQSAYLSTLESGEFSWFERYSKLHARDIPTINTLETVVEELALAAESPDRIRVMSRQMGMVAYHIARREPRRVSLMDLYGLTDRVLTSCDPVETFRRSQRGISVGLEGFLEDKSRFETECGVKPPHVIYSLSEDLDETRQMYDKFGYTIVYFQRGKIGIEGSSFPGILPNTRQVIAVDSRLVSRLSSNRSEVVF